MIKMYAIREIIRNQTVNTYIILNFYDNILTFLNANEHRADKDCY